MEFAAAVDLGFCPRCQMGRIFAEGFYHWLKFFSKNPDTLARAFEHTFVLDNFYVAHEDGAIAAMVACGGTDSVVRLLPGPFIKEFGPLRGFFNYLLLRRYVGGSSFPFVLGKTTGSIEFVTTQSAYRGRGLAFDLINYVMGHTPYDSYVLEVADTNYTAVRLYERLGFKEMRRTKASASKRTGINYFLYMRKSG